MDLWVLVAAAATGYLSKCWQNPSNYNLSESSSVDFKYGKSESPSCPLGGLARGKKLTEDFSALGRKKSDGKTSDIDLPDGALAIEATSADGGSWGNYSISGPLSLSSLQAGFSADENLQENEERNWTGDVCDNYAGLPIGQTEMNPFHESVRNRSSIRSQLPYRRLIKPLNSLESCLMAQMYKEHIKTEEYVLSSLPSPSTPTTRPLLVTNGRQVISKLSGDSFNLQMVTEDHKLHKEVCSKKNEYGFGVPPLPKIVSFGLPKKIKSRTGKGHGGGNSNFRKMVSGKLFHLQGLHDATVLFSLGISIGIISSFIANRKEVDKLKELLKQTDNLVQDLQEELDMKDSLTVKELTNENYGLQDAYNFSHKERAPSPLSPQRNLDNSRNYDGNESCDEKAGETSDSMSKIEAELEAELERLGLNVNASSLDRRLSDVIEIEPEYVADFAQGELRADKIDENAAQSESNHGGSDTCTPHSGNYAVSPRELSLRLHEVIQSRLEERVKELETALLDSQRKVRLMETEHKNSWTKFSRNDEYVLEQETPIAGNDCNSIGEPLVMNLSGEALDAYSEAYEELMKINESEEDSPTKVYENNYKEGYHFLGKNVSRSQNNFTNGSLSHLMDYKEEISENFFYNQQGMESSRVQELLDVGVSEDESSDSNDEMEKRLIKQIVEKTKKGSPVVLNAQKVFYSVNEN